VRQSLAADEWTDPPEDTATAQTDGGEDESSMGETEAEPATQPNEDDEETEDEAGTGMAD